MGVLAARDLLNLWEIGNGCDHTTRALLMLGATESNLDGVDIPGLPIGERDRRLFDLRRRNFGSRIEALEMCPECCARLEIAFDLSDIQVEHDIQAGEPFILETSGYRLLLRLPSSRDLQSIGDGADLERMRLELLSRCVVQIDEEMAEPDPANLPGPVQRAIADSIAQRDSQAEVLLALDCAECGNSWRAHFDIVEYLWTEIDRASRRVLIEVHLLATAYGWPEDVILELSPRRRAIYLGMVSGD